ncbi:uncharacterized protein Z520_12259 [Fonsecaea multimorphosa CBS 102226]|uniref:Major facilitator superfamily (MFS) profile domain-containing protein n=1 Tax=Fonsecaea multimorphosa CBS 102226 TaxID=1442371 RepID=A0A0D2K6Q0_9EURO|nr:uncharacterized protein Z520_12259 [Fonsecaea multimorphosa CBS 102226]KIX92043.1 hypothetical protein Z520_12259 [Fonsecaea multimorphosa CBS 102226]
MAMDNGTIEGDEKQLEGDKVEQQLENVPAVMPPAADDGLVTLNTGFVVSILSTQFGTAFWPIPTSFVLAVCIAFMTCGANSDLFGRRDFVLFGNVLTFISNIVARSAKQANTVMIAMTVMDFGSGNCQLAANVFWGGTTDITTGVLTSLTPNIGLVVGGMLTVAFVSRLRNWKWTLTGSVVITGLFGAPLALGQPGRKGMMIAFLVPNQITMGWGQYLSIAHTQLE